MTTTKTESTTTTSPVIPAGRSTMNATQTLYVKPHYRCPGVFVPAPCVVFGIGARVCVTDSRFVIDDLHGATGTVYEEQTGISNPMVRAEFDSPVVAPHCTFTRIGARPECFELTK